MYKLKRSIANEFRNPDTRAKVDQIIKLVLMEKIILPQATQSNVMSLNNLPPCCGKNVYLCLTKPLHIIVVVLLCGVTDK